MTYNRTLVQIIEGDEITDEILNTLKDIFNEDELDPDMEGKIDSLIAYIGDDKYYLIEYPYVDKLYRDSYYNYFSSKHNNYKRDVIRISVFESEILYSDFRNPERFEQLEKLLIGYFIIRPTMPRIFGRSLFSKKINSDVLSCSYSDSILVNGVKMIVNGFPHSSQDAENISCAETSLWVIMEYFSNKYSYFKSVLPSDILKILNVKSDERLLPTEGLTVQQISYALKEFGFGAKIYSHEHFNFKEIMLTYLDSGIPFIANLTDLETLNDAHSIVVFGKELINKKILDNWVLQENGEDISYYDTGNLDVKLLVMDDNQHPYKLVNFTNPFSDSADELYNGLEFHSIVVPLYPKIYLEASQAKSLAHNILNDIDFGFKFDPEYVSRFFLASSRSFKMHISSQSSLDEIIKDEIIYTPMPKFIWCLEISKNKDSFADANGIGLLIIDATEINKISINSLIVGAYPDRIFTNYNNNLLSLPKEFKNYTLYNNNLK